MHWSNLSPEQQEIVHDVWSLLIVQGAQHAHPLDAAPVRFRDLVIWAVGDAEPLPTRYKRALLVDPVLRRDFDLLLRCNAIAIGGRAAAASTGLLGWREGNGFDIRIVPSRTGDGTYIKISYRDLPKMDGKVPSLLVVIAPDGVRETMVIIDSDEEGAQMLCANDHPVVALLGNPDTEILLL